ncbi:hypothetical protein BJY04DRAFT_220548 [Aspergillus karnatakaensis]|uniref:uncharacterized protein n=1 Tax=Aspergillus karnatakaensis TaxID=1810916 RepID=UPI003CCD6591
MANNNHPFGPQFPFPAEVTARIFEFVVGVTPAYVNRRTFPAYLLTVNRAWNAALRPYTTADFSYDGDANDIEDLWNFVEEVVTQPNRARELRQLTFTSASLFERFEPQDVSRVLVTTFKHGDNWLRKPRGAAQAYNQPTVMDNDDVIFA